jgi:CBS domain-containing protein
MAGKINEVMTADPKTVGSDDSLSEAAKIMRDADIGDVVVVDDGQVTGILTDRDIAVRAVAAGKDPDSTPAGEVCTGDLVTLEPDQSTEDAIKAMRDQDVRRLPVVQDGQLVGIVSLGDLAVERDPDSTLADISASSPNN